MYRVRTVINSNAVSGGPWLNTINFEQGLGQGDADAAAALVATFWGNVDSFLHTSVTWNLDTEVVEINDLGVIQRVFNVAPASGSGVQGANQILPPATQMLVRLLTGVYVNGRQLRGKFFIPGFTEATNAQGVVDGGQLATIQGYVNTLVAGTGNLQPVVWSQTYFTTEEVSAGQVASKWSVLRSRKD